MNGLLADDMGLYRGGHNDNPQYNFMYVDALLDFLLSINIKTFVELDFMPQALSSGSGTIFCWKRNVTPPKDYKRWEDLKKNLDQYFIELIDYCEKNDLTIDFISTHAYGVNQGFLDEYGNTGTPLVSGKFAISSDVMQSRMQITESSIPGSELHYTEWSESYTLPDKAFNNR